LTCKTSVAVFMGLIALTPAVACPQGAEQGALLVQIGKTVKVTASYRDCWFPTVHRFPTGEILVTARMSPDEVNPEGDFSAYCISRDGGNTWSERYTLGPGANVDGSYTRFSRHDGSILNLYNWLLSFPSGQSEQFHTTLTTYCRAGMEVKQVRNAIVRFSEPVHMLRTQVWYRKSSPASELSEVADVWTFGSIIKALNGDLLSTAHCKFARDEHYRSILLHSNDGGATWHYFSTIAAEEPTDKEIPWMGDEGPTETSIVRLRDKRLYAIYRTNGFMGESWSSDDGTTWTPPKSTGFIGVAPRVIRMSNGILACTYGRPGPVTVMFSVDGRGDDWAHLTTIFSGMSTRYTDLVQVSPNELFVVYDSVPRPWHKTPPADKAADNAIYGTFIRVKR
jgi:hypothetical protein